MRIRILLTLLLFSAIGCGAQVQPTAAVYQCPTPNYGNGLTANYTPIQSSPSAYLAAGTTTYADDGNSTGVYCYIAQAWEGSTSQISSPSNVATATVSVGMAGNVTLSWTNVCTSCLIVISKTKAVQVAPPAPPTVGTPTVAALEKPIFKPNPNLVLMASVK